jgi:hypothetical protein
MASRQVGLCWLSEVGPVSFGRSLRTLGLCQNGALFNDLESTQLFVRNLLLSGSMKKLKELDIAQCGEHMPAIIKACENDNCKVEALIVWVWVMSTNLKPIVDQLIQSIPKMKRMRGVNLQLYVSKRSAMTTALQQNTSLVQVMSSMCNPETRRLFNPLLNRNVHLGHADSLLALQPKTQRPIGSKNGIWAVAFANMAKPFYNIQEPQSDDEEDYSYYNDHDDVDDDHTADSSDDDAASSFDDTDDSSDDDASFVEEQGSDQDLQLLHSGGDDDEEDGSNMCSDHSTDSCYTYGLYTGASAIFKILQKRPTLFEVHN